MSEYAEAVRRARRSVANNNALATVHALEPHLDEVMERGDLRPTLDLAWALGELGRCAEREALLSSVRRPTPEARMTLSLARAGWF